MVWLGPEGKPDFSGLQAALKSGGKGLTYFVFDLLEVDGEDLTRLPNILRKERLRGLIPGQRDAVIQYADHIVGEGEKLLRSDGHPSEHQPLMRLPYAFFCLKNKTPTT